MNWTNLIDIQNNTQTLDAHSVVLCVKNKTNNQMFICSTKGSAQSHLHSLIRDSYIKRRSDSIYEAIRTCGVGSFEVCILEISDDPIKAKQYWISYYDTRNCGYNTERSDPVRGQKISKTKKGIPLPESQRRNLEKAVLQIEIGTGKVLEEFSSLTEASQKSGVSAPNISSCCRGKLKHANG